MKGETTDASTDKLKMTLADLMILVAATAVSLACFLLIDNTLYGGGRYLFGLFSPPQRTWDSREILDRASGVSALVMTMFGAWTLAVPLLAGLRPRPVRLRLLRGAGTSACLAACFGIVACVGTTALAFTCRWLDGWKPLHPNFWYFVPILDSVFIFSGVSVGAVWISSWVVGRWRGLPNVIDRVGRLMGVLWIMAALVFATRLFIGPNW